jgi:hypothetical protein
MSLKKLAAALFVIAASGCAGFAQEQQPPVSLVKVTAPVPTPSQFKLDQPASSSLALTDSLQPTDAGSPSSGGYVRIAPAPQKEKKLPSTRPFRTVAFGFSANTAGASFEIATPVAHAFNLRSSLNVFAFNYPFSIDGVNYDARLHLKSSATTLDWFPLRDSFHISPGIMYVKNTLTAPASVGPGQNFELGSQPFINSVDDPVSGYSSVVFPRKYAPMLLLGFGNIIPRSGKHLSFPVEFGAAYTGAPQISVALNGSACTPQGCVSFAANKEAQDSLKQEVYLLNEDLKRVPVYPIVSVGVAYHF